MDSIKSGFALLAKPANPNDKSPAPQFAQSAKDGLSSNDKGVVVYYSNRCPFTEFHIGTSLHETCKKRGITPKIIKLDSLAAAQNAPSPATIFSLFIDGAFITTDLSVCMDSHFDEIVAKAAKA